MRLQNLQEARYIGNTHPIVQWIRRSIEDDTIPDFWEVWDDDPKQVF